MEGERVNLCPQQCKSPKQTLSNICSQHHVSESSTVMLLQPLTLMKMEARGGGGGGEEGGKRLWQWRVLNVKIVWCSCKGNEIR